MAGADFLAALVACTQQRGKYSKSVQRLVCCPSQPVRALEPFFGRAEKVTVLQAGLQRATAAALLAGAERLYDGHFEGNAGGVGANLASGLAAGGQAHAGAKMLAVGVLTNCLRGAFPPVDFLAVCAHEAGGSASPEGNTPGNNRALFARSCGYNASHRGYRIHTTAVIQWRTDTG